MYDFNSRYYNLPTQSITMPDGRTVAYSARRFLPQGSDLPLLVEAAVQPGDRLDLVTARVLGDPEAFWRVCDANDAMDPGELTQEPGRLLRIPVPQP